MKNETMGEFMDRVVKCKTKKEAAIFVKKEIKDSIKKKYQATEDEARKVILSNIGYCSGYYDRKTMTKIQDLFNAPHPIFGRSIPTTKEAFEAGLKLGRKIKNETDKTVKEVKNEN